MSSIKNAEFVGKKECTTPASKVIKSTLAVLQAHGYIGNFEYVEDNRGGKFKIELLGKINSCGVIKPKFSVKKDKIDRYAERFLPARDFGILILTTSSGIMDHVKAKELGIGGRLLCFVY
jgi:small subunit ribosomal protein S8